MSEETETAESADETVAGTSHGAGGDETEVVAPVTEAAPELAWSLDDETPEPAPIASTWGWVLGHAAVLVSIAFVVALVVGVVGWVMFVAMRPSDAPGTMGFHPSTPPKPSPASAPASAAPQAKPPVDDDEYVAMAISPEALNGAPNRTGGFGTAGSQDEANRIALSECRAVSGNDDCLLVNAGMYHGCVGFAFDGPRWASGSGAEAAAAENDALRRIGAGGRLGWAQCSNPPGILRPSPAPAAALPPAYSTTVTVQAAPTTAPAVAPSPEDADRIFREGVSGVPGIRIINWDVAEAGARSICSGFARGMSRAQVIDSVQRNDPTFTPAQTSGMVNVALAAYCPQYEGN